MPRLRRQTQLDQAIDRVQDTIRIQQAALDVLLQARKAGVAVIPRELPRPVPQKRRDATTGTALLDRNGEK
jgi:hypothetical protein